MSLDWYHRRKPGSPDWRKLALGLITALLMSLQGAAALAHSHSHVDGYRLAQDAQATPASPEISTPGKPAPGAACQLCHSSFGAASILPLPTTGMAGLLSITHAALPALHQIAPRAIAAGVWRVRGPPASLHA